MRYEIVHRWVYIFIAACSVQANHLRRGHRKKWGNVFGDYDGYDDDDDDDDDHHHTMENFPRFHEFSTTTTLWEEGNVTLTSIHCPSNECDGDWGPWQSWSSCNTPLPGYSTEPRCYNTIRHRKRFCVGADICVKGTWELCLHNASCYGEWSMWSEYNGSCDVACTRSINRKRVCLEDGVETPGLCEGAGKDSVQYNIKACKENVCSDVTTMLLIILSCSAAVLVAIISAIFVICIRCRKNSKMTDRPLYSSSSFLLGYWRTVSRRFTRRKRTGLQSSLQQEVAIGGNYNAIHVYENPGEYSQVKDAAYSKPDPDAIDDEYGIPLYRRNDTKRRGSTVTSVESKYAMIGEMNAYEKMIPASSKFARDMRRAQSLDGAIDFPEKEYRPRPIPGADTRVPRYRGATDHFERPSRGLRKKPSNVASGVAARILRKKSMSTDNLSTKIWNSEVQEDRYGYLVPSAANPNSYPVDPNREKSSTFAGLDNLSRYDPMNKSASLPLDSNVYVTMNRSCEFKKDDTLNAISNKVGKLRSMFDP